MAENRTRTVVPVIYRVFHATVQRVAVSIKNLNSNASFLIIVEEDKQVLVWVGHLCEAEDAELANTIAETVMKRDFRDAVEEPIPTVIEGEESNDTLEVMLDIFWSSTNQYFSKASATERRKELINSSVSVGLLETSDTISDFYDFQETAFAHPDSRGVVPRVTFVPIEMNTIAYVNVGDHWDVWCARAVPDSEIEKVMSFVRSTVASHLSLVDNAATRQNNVLGQYVHLIRQGEEDTLFRRPLKIFTDYEPPGKCAPRPDPAPRMRKEVDKKTQKLLAKQAAEVVNAARESKQDDEDGTVLSGPLAMETSQDGDAALAMEGARSPVIDFYSVAPVKDDHRLQSSNDDVYPMIHETVTIKDYDGIYGLDPNSVDAEMLRVVETANENPERRKMTVEEAAKNPRTLIGYQVEIDEGVYAGVFIVTQVRKTILKKTIFHLCALDKDEFWIRLRRNKKSGVPFRPLRRIVQVQFIEPVKAGSSKSIETNHAAASPLADSSASAALHKADFGAAASAPLATGRVETTANEGEQEAAEYALILNQYTGDE